MCEVHVTVKLNRVECSLSDADSHLFQIRRVPARAFCLMSVQQYVGRKVGYECKIKHKI